jgi:molybdate-binding protein/DNA-binding XRE family transcriptional regulator
VSVHDRKIAQQPVLTRRLARGWSQSDLAKRVGISRAAVSAIEGQRLSPSVATALALADVFECSVEELFRIGPAEEESRTEWAWAPRAETSRYWEAQVGRRHLLYPVEAHGVNPSPHDGVWNNGVCRERQSSRSEKTLVLASCDPGAGILAAEYARETGFRLLIFPRAGLAALELLRQGLIHGAALHRSTPNAQQRNARTVRERLGDDFQLVRAADWEEGLAVTAELSKRSIRSVAAGTRCWAARELGSGARECLDELLAGRRLVGREVSGHESVAEAVRSGWAGAGVCVRFAAEEAHLRFIPIRKESLDFCFPTASQQDPRVKALIRLLRTRGYRRLVSELPGYDARHTGELTAV